MLELSETAIRATVTGKSGLALSPIKAVTFHDLGIKRTGHGFRTTFVVDVVVQAGIAKLVARLEPMAVIKG